MGKFGQALVNFLQNEDGPTAVEYAVMLALILVVCITVVTTLDSNAKKTFQQVGAQIGQIARRNPAVPQPNPGLSPFASSPCPLFVGLSVTAVTALLLSRLHRSDKSASAPGARKRR